MNDSRKKRSRGTGPRSAATAAVPEVPPTPGPAPGRDRRTWVCALLPALAAFLAFAPGLHNDFVAYWDDNLNLLGNPAFQGFDAAHLRWAWTTFHMGVYQPIGWMLLEAQYAIGGLDPHTYHGTSLVLYIAEAVALYALSVVLVERCRGTQESTPNPWRVHLGAGLAVALFVAHPLRDEVVEWASCQPYLAAALFGTLAVLAYLHAYPEGRAPRPVWAVLALVLTIAAMLSKAVAVTLPAVLFLLDVYVLGRIGEPGSGVTASFSGPSARWAWAEKVVYFAVAGVFLVLARRARDHSQIAIIGHILVQGPLNERIAQACYGAAFYLVKTVWPSGLTACYVLPLHISWSEPQYPLAALLVATISGSLFLARRKHPAWFAAWLSYLVILAPNSGLSRIGTQMAANRYAYVAMMGLTALAAAGLARAATSRPRAIGLGVAGLALLAGLISLSWRQCEYWHDSIPLWRRVMAFTEIVDPNVHVNLGKALLQTGDTEGAVESFARALRYYPDHRPAHAMMGRALLTLGRPAEAEVQLAEAVRIQPLDDDRAYLGIALMQQGKPAEAEAHFADVLRRRPGDASLQNNMGAAQAQQRKLAEAADHFAAAVRLDPDYLVARKNLGEALFDRGLFDEAGVQLAEVVRRMPDHQEALLLLANALAEQGRLAEARVRYESLLKLSPENPKALEGLGTLDAKTRHLLKP
jgi:Flp pilus assembly protein TadD